MLEYRYLCDICGKETKNSGFYRKVRIYIAAEGYHQHEDICTNKDFCSDCLNKFEKHVNKFFKEVK